MPPRKKGSTVQKPTSKVAEVEKENVGLVENKEKQAVAAEMGEKGGIRGSDLEIEG